MKAINLINDILSVALDQDIKQSREQIEYYFRNQKANIQNNLYMTDYEKMYYLNFLEAERLRLINIQDKRELVGNLSKFCNELSKYFEEREREVK